MKSKLMVVKVAAILVAIVLFAVFPLFIQGYWIRVLTSLFMYAGMAEALNLMVGYAGYAAFGNGVFYGIGAYATAVLMTRFGWGFFQSMIVSALFAAFIALVLGLPILRLRGHYFAIATIGVNMAIMELVTYIEITGGGKGISLPIYSGDIVAQGRFFYYLMFIVLVASVILTVWIVKSRFGYGLRAIKTEPEAAEVMGVNTTLYKVIAWSISAFIFGLIGSISGYWLTFLEPIYVFDIMISVECFVMVLLGGAGTILGPVIGAFSLETLSELLWSRFTLWHLGILGLIIVLVVMFIPNGIMGIFKQSTFSLRKLFKSQ